MKFATQAVVLSGFLYFVIWTIPFVVAQQPPISFPPATQLTPLINATVKQGSTASTLRYSYTVANSQQSVQALALWALQYPASLTVNILATPSSWISNVSVGGQPLVGWAALSLLGPGSSQNGFDIESESLPGIGQALVVGFIPFGQLPAFPQGKAPADLPGSSVVDNSVKVTTVGPVPIPSTVDPLGFLNTVVALKEQAFALGWIDNRGIKTSLDAKLNAAQASLTGGQTQVARNQLTALLNEVDAQAGKHLTSEAFALLKFNIEFLLTHL